MAPFAPAVGVVEVTGTDAAGNPSRLSTGNLTSLSGLGGIPGFDFAEGAAVDSNAVILGGSTTVVVRGVGPAGDPTTWTLADRLELGLGTSAVPTSVTVEAGGQVSSARVMIGAGGGSNGRITLSSNDAAHDSTWVSSGDMYVGGRDTEPRGDGAFELLAGSRAEIAGALKVWSPGTVTLQEGHLIADTIEHTDGGAFDFQSGVLEVFRFEGDLLNQGGTLQPNPNVRSTTIFGDYTQQQDATLALEIGGTSPGGTHDLVTVTGASLLDGLLDVALTDNFIPSANDLFTVFAADSLLGFFDNVTNGQRLDTTDGLGSFVVNYGVGSAFDESRIVLNDFLAAATIPGDFDLDGDVDGRDFLAWQRGSSPNPLSANDLAIWENNYGGGSTPLASFAAARAVPEPATWGLMLLAATLGLCQRRTIRLQDSVATKLPRPELPNGQGQHLSQVQVAEVSAADLILSNSFELAIASFSAIAI